MTTKTKRRKESLVGYCHRSNIINLEYGWKEITFCCRKSFKKGWIENLNKKYFRKVRITIEEIK